MSRISQWRGWYPIGILILAVPTYYSIHHWWVQVGDVLFAFLIGFICGTDFALGSETDLRQPAGTQVSGATSAAKDGKE